MSNAIRKAKRKIERAHFKQRVRRAMAQTSQRPAERHNNLSGIIVHGARCVWWDNIENAGALKAVHPLPCCPHCGSVLYQFDNETAFWAGSAEYDRTHPGYINLMKWLKGKCFRTMADAAVTYEAETGIHYEVEARSANGDK